MDPMRHGLLRSAHTQLLMLYAGIPPLGLSESVVRGEVQRIRRHLEAAEGYLESIDIHCGPRVFKAPVPPPLPAPEPVGPPPIPIKDHALVFSDVDLTTSGVWSLPEPVVIGFRSSLTVELRLSGHRTPSFLSRIFTDLVSPAYGETTDHRNPACIPSAFHRGHRSAFNPEVVWGQHQMTLMSGYINPKIDGQVSDMWRRWTGGPTILGSPLCLQIVNQSHHDVILERFALVFGNAIAPATNSWELRESLKISCCFCGVGAGEPCVSAQGPHARGREVPYIHRQRARTFKSLPTCSIHAG